MKMRTLGAAAALAAASFLIAGEPLAVCDRPAPHRLLFRAQTDLEVPSQVLLAKNKDELRRILNRLGIGPTTNDSRMFDTRSITMRRYLVIIGRPRANGCRETEFLCVQHALTPTTVIGAVEAVIAEHFPGCGCVCTDVFKGSAVFVVAVPDWVSRADLVSLRRVHNCERCDDDCPLGAETIDGDTGNVEIDSKCP